METIEQKLRGAYNKLTGRLATSDQAGYFAFCKGVEYGIAEERESANQDAIRYRWLRDNKYLDAWWSIQGSPNRCENIDADIDAAIG